MRADFREIRVEEGSKRGTYVRVEGMETIVQVVENAFARGANGVKNETFKVSRSIRPGSSRYRANVNSSSVSYCSS